MPSPRKIIIYSNPCHRIVWPVVADSRADYRFGRAQSSWWCAVLLFYKNVQDGMQAKLDIMELDGSLIKSFTNTSKEKTNQLQIKSGGNRHIWDMRYEGYKTFPGMVFYSAPTWALKRFPVNTKARLTINGQSSEQEFEILADPRIKTTPEEFKQQFDFLISVRNKVSRSPPGHPRHPQDQRRPGLSA